MKENKNYFDIFQNTNNTQKFFIVVGTLVVISVFIGSIALSIGILTNNLNFTENNKDDPCSIEIEIEAYKELPKNQILNALEMTEKLTEETNQKDLKQQKKEKKCLKKLKKELKRRNYI